MTTSPTTQGAFLSAVASLRTCQRKLERGDFRTASPQLEKRAISADARRHAERVDRMLVELLQPSLPLDSLTVQIDEPTRMVLIRAAAALSLVNPSEAIACRNLAELVRGEGLFDAYRSADTRPRTVKGGA